LLTAIVVIGFFVVIAGALQFSSWAEGWLASGASPNKKRALDVESSPVSSASASALEHKPAHAA
jgi:hypothetical protein